MDLDKYQELTGTTVKASAVPKVEAEINRSGKILETILGYSLSENENLYIEQGISPVSCFCPSTDAALNDPDEVVGAYRLFPYDSRDVNLFVDPFTEVHAVKLVKDGVTIKVFDEKEYRIEVGRDGLSKYIQDCPGCVIRCICTDCVQLAVDADWFPFVDEGVNLPDDLLYVWSDMVTYYADASNKLRSQSVGSHSWTKFENLPEEQRKHNLAVLKRYAGPYGAISRTYTL